MLRLAPMARRRDGDTFTVSRRPFTSRRWRRL